MNKVMSRDGGGERRKADCASVHWRYINSVIFFSAKFCTFSKQYFSQIQIFNNTLEMDKLFIFMSRQLGLFACFPFVFCSVHPAL